MFEKQLLIEYSGPLSFSVINKLLAELKEQCDALGEKIATYKRILIIMVEVLENINKYLESKSENKILTQYPIDFQLIKTENKYLIKARNIVGLDVQELLKNKIDLVNKLNTEELKVLYREIISNGQFTEEGGAGLGFIEIAKTSQHKILYSFEKVNDTYSYFTINLELIG